jgi:hypothetical protein
VSNAPQIHQLFPFPLFSLPAVVAAAACWEYLSDFIFPDFHRKMGAAAAAIPAVPKSRASVESSF